MEKKPFSTINNLWRSRNKSNLTFVIFEAVCQSNFNVERTWLELSSYISRNIFQKFLNISVSNNLLLWSYRSW